MEVLVVRIVMIMVLAFFLSCGKKNQTPSPPYRAKIVVSTSEGYKWQVVTFSSLKNIEKLDGDFAKIIGQAKLRLDIPEDQEEAIVNDDPDKIYYSTGQSFKLDYEVKDGIIYPTTFDSLTALSIYYHYEQVITFWRDNMDFDLTKFGKLRLFYNPSIVAKGKSEEFSATLKLNAAFLPISRDFWFFKTSPIEEIPLKVNLAVLAHEFGHAIFNEYVAHREAKFYNTKSAAASNQLSGINEGISDYFAWMVTRRKKEFTESLSVMSDRIPPVNWTTFKLATTPSVCDGGFYCKGSILFSALYELAESPTESEIAVNNFVFRPQGKGAVAVGKILISALQAFRTDWLNHREEDNFDYHYLINRIIAASPENERADYCDVFLKWFNDSANEGKIKEACGR